MAKKDKLNTDEFKLDDDLNFDDFDFNEVDGQLSAEANGKKRSPVIQVFKGTIKGIAEEAISPSLLAKVTKEALPAQYGTVIDKTSEAARSISSLYDEAVREVKPQVARLAKKVDKLVPENSKLLKKLTTKFKDFAGDETSSYSGQSKEALEEAAISSSLAEVFQAQAEQQNNIQARQMAENKIKDNIEAKRFNNSFTLLSSINNQVTRVASYTEKVTQAYQKKSLELQFRSYFVQAELLKTTNTFFEIFNKQNESIAKNTALPEFVKIHNSEKFVELARTKFMNKIQGSLFGDESLFKRAVDNLREKVMSQVRDFKFGLEEGISALEGIDQTRETLESMGIDRSEFLGQNIGAGIANHYGKKLGKKIRSKIPDDSRLARFGYTAADKLNNLGGSIKDLENSKFVQDNMFDNGAKGFGAKAIKFFTGLFDLKGPDLALETPSGLNGLDKAAIFNNKTQTSITEIIPGYLARILREVGVLSTGDKNLGFISYDFSSGKFKHNKQLAADIKSSLISKIKNSSYEYKVDNAAKTLLKDNQIDDKQLKKVKDFISKLSTLKISYTPENIRNTQLYRSLDEETAKLIDSTLMIGIELADENEKEQYRFSKAMLEVRDSTPDIRGDIEGLVRAGYGHFLEKDSRGNVAINGGEKSEGLITTDKDGKVNINEDELFRMIRENTLGEDDSTSHSYVTSDMRVKENIKKFNPKKALDAVRKTKVYDWLFKKGHGDNKDGDGSRHVGPMAQDIRRNMGNDVAPNGTSIDITSMNGINMAAIQELRERQNKLDQKDNMPKNETSTLLQSINNDTLEIVKLLKEKRSGFSIPGDMKDKFNLAKDAMANKDYTSMIKNLFNTTLDIATQAGKDIFGFASKGFTFGKDKIYKPFMEFITKKYDDNKDGFKNKVSELFGKASDLASKVLTFSQDLIVNKLPKGYKYVADLAVKAKNSFMEHLADIRDIYIKGETTPIIKARLLKAGYYFDQASGAVLKSVNDIKGPVVDKLGNIVLSIEDFASGLFDNKGEEIKSKLSSIAEKAKDLLSAGYSRVKGLANSTIDFLKTKGIGGKLQSMMPSGISSNKTHNVIVEIRDILSEYTGIKPKASSLGGSIAETSRKSETWTERFQKMTEDMRNKRLGKTNETAQADTSEKYRVSGSLGGLLDKGQDILGSVKGAKGFKGKGLALLGGLFGQNKVDDLADKAKDKKEEILELANKKKDELKKAYENRNNEDGLLTKAKDKINQYKDKAKAAFNDRDGSGERDGSWKDRLNKMMEDRKNKKLNKADIDLKQKYRSEGGFLSSLMDKAKSLFGLLTGGISGLFNMASGVFNGISGLLGLGGKGVMGKIGKTIGAVVKSPFKLLGGVAKVASAVGTPLVKGIGMLKNAPMAANILSKVGMVRNALMIGSAMTGGVGSAVMGALSVGMTAISGILTAPVLIGAAAIAAAGYVAYKTYKHITRNDTDEFIEYRLKQYGLLVNESDKHHVNEILSLEDYLESEDVVGYRAGEAYLIKQKLDVEKIYSIFSIDKDDEKRVESFIDWFQNRFKPFYLTHLTALFAVNNKIKLSELKSLSIEEQSKYLELTSFENGPYDLASSPFSDVEELNTDKSIPDESAEILKDAIKKGFKDKNKNNKKSVTKKKEEETNKANTTKPTSFTDEFLQSLKTNTTKPLSQLNQNTKLPVAGGLGEDGKYKENNASVIAAQKESIPSIGRPKLASGGLESGDLGINYITKDKGVNLEGVNPALLKNFLAMVEEYYNITGKKVHIKDGKRSYEEQAAIYSRDKTAARPGESLHEHGLAIDASSVSLNEMEKLGLMRKYGFTRPVGGETWHIEPAGIQGQHQRAKRDINLANELIASSLYRGGGGYGTIPGSPKGKRNKELALKLLGINSEVIDAEKEKEKLVSSNDNFYNSNKPKLLTPKTINTPQTSAHNKLMSGSVTPKPKLALVDKQPAQNIPKEQVTESEPKPRETKSLFKYNQQPARQVAEKSDGIGSSAISKSVDNISNTLSQSLSVQTETLQVLKTLAANLTPEQFKALLSSINTKDNTPKPSSQPRTMPSAGVSLKR